MKGILLVIKSSDKEGKIELAAKSKSLKSSKLLLANKIPIKSENINTKPVK